MYHIQTKCVNYLKCIKCNIWVTFLVLVHIGASALNSMEVQVLFHYRLLSGLQRMSNDYLLNYQIDFNHFTSSSSSQGNLIDRSTSKIVPSAVLLETDVACTQYILFRSNWQFSVCWPSNNSFLICLKKCPHRFQPTLECKKCSVARGI